MSLNLQLGDWVPKDALIPQNARDGIVAAADLPFINVTDAPYSAPSDGITDARTAIFNANAAAISAGSQLAIPAGAFYVASNLTLTASVMMMGGVLKPNAGVTITISGPFTAPIKRCFDTSLGGTITFSADTIVESYPEWWTTNATPGTTDMLGALDASLAAFNRTCLVGSKYRVSGPVVMPTWKTLYGRLTTPQQMPALRVDGVFGFTGNVVLGTTNDPVGGGTTAYVSVENLGIEIINYSNAAMVTAFFNMSENCVLRNLSWTLYSTDVTTPTLVKRLLETKTGPLLIDTINVCYPLTAGTGTNSVTDYPIYCNGNGGLIFRNLNFLGGAVFAKGPCIVGGPFSDLSGWNIETHPAAANEPSITLIPYQSMTFRDVNIYTTVVGSLGILLETEVSGQSRATYDLSNILMIPKPGGGGGSFDRIIRLKNAAGTTKDWDGTLFQNIPSKIIKFNNREQTFKGTLDHNFGPNTFTDTFCFTSISTGGTMTVPFNPRIAVGGNGAGSAIISINSRCTGPVLNGALIWLQWYDAGGIVPQFNYIYGGPYSGSGEPPDTGLATWDPAYAAGVLTFVNKNAGTADYVVVTVIHSSYATFPG